MRHVFLTLVGVGLLAGLAGLVGCQAQREVLGDNIKETVDSALGKMNVQKKEVEIGLREMKSAIGEIQKAKIEAVVRLEQLDKKMKPIQENQEKTQVALTKIKKWLDDGVSVDVGGESYDIAKLKKLATDTIEKHKDLKRQSENLVAEKAKLQKVHDSLEEKQTGLNKRYKNLENQLVALNDQILQAQAIEKASSLVGSGDETLTSKIDQIEGNLTKLEATTRKVLLTEEEKFNEAMAKESTAKVDDLINATAEPADLSSEIDAILKK